MRILFLVAVICLVFGLLAAGGAWAAFNLGGLFWLIAAVLAYLLSGEEVAAFVQTRRRVPPPQ